ncbi:MAG: hypothetical protein AB8G11_12420 [Saprospiraceae bacterium]
MPVITTAAMIGGIVTYVGTQLAKNESLSGFFNDFTSETVNWIKPLFLKEDGTLQKEVQKLKENPATKKQRVELMLQDEVEDNPNAAEYIKEIFEKISKMEEGEKIVNTITNSKNVVNNSNISADGNIQIGDNHK